MQYHFITPGKPLGEKTRALTVWGICARMESSKRKGDQKMKKNGAILSDLIFVRSNWNGLRLFREYRKNQFVGFVVLDQDAKPVWRGKEIFQALKALNDF